LFAEIDALPVELGNQLIAHAVRSTQMEPLGGWIDDVNGSRLGARQFHGLGDNSRENRSEVERGVHRLRHLAERTQLPYRLRKLTTARFQLVRALLTLLLQPGIGFLQLARHGVELVGKRFELVASFDGDALAEVAAPEARGTCPQRLNRADHAAGE